jgi:isoquinoline 1-oxidoreductase beta subunit
VAEVSIQERAITVHRVVCAIDCGRAINPETIRAQMEGGIVLGLSAALYGQITLKQGRAQQTNVHDYPVLRFNSMPAVEVHVVPSGGQVHEQWPRASAQSRRLLSAVQLH